MVVLCEYDSPSSDGKLTKVFKLKNWFIGVDFIYFANLKDSRNSPFFSFQCKRRAARNWSWSLTTPMIYMPSSNRWGECGPQWFIIFPLYRRIRFYWTVFVSDTLSLAIPVCWTIGQGFGWDRQTDSNTTASILLNCISLKRLSGNINWFIGHNKCIARGCCGLRNITPSFIHISLYSYPGTTRREEKGVREAAIQLNGRKNNWIIGVFNGIIRFIE